VGAFPLKPIIPVMSHLRFSVTRKLLSIVLALIVPSVLMGRIMQPWTFREMFDKADLVVIAEVVSTKDTDERSTLLEEIKVVGVVTDFKSLLILKGPKSATTFQLHHYRLQNKADVNVMNGPDLVQIGPHNPAFLLFLTKEHDGRYAPVTGQTDPATFSVVPLNTGVSD
jgi:hypothetical protein